MEPPVKTQSVNAVVPPFMVRRRQVQDSDQATVEQQRIRQENRRQLDPSVRRRNERVLRHLGLAHLAAGRQLARGTGEHDDLLQEAQLGLIKASERFDPSRGHRISSYVMALANGQIMHFRRDRERTLHIPWRLLNLHAQGMKIQQQWLQQGLPPFLTRQLADALDVSVDRWLQALEAHQHRYLVSLHQPGTSAATSTGAAATALIEQLADSRTDTKTDHQLEWLHQAMRQLPDHARQLLIRHYVLGETVRQIGRQKGLSHVEVKTVLRQSLQVLQEMAAGRDGVGDQPRC